MRAGHIADGVQQREGQQQEQSEGDTDDRREQHHRHDRQQEEERQADHDRRTLAFLRHVPDGVIQLRSEGQQDQPECERRE
jgi:hypothetical protein